MTSQSDAPGGARPSRPRYPQERRLCVRIITTAKGPLPDSRTLQEWACLVASSAIANTTDPTKDTGRRRPRSDMVAPDFSCFHNWRKVDCAGGALHPRIAGSRPRIRQYSSSAIRFLRGRGGATLCGGLARTTSLFAAAFESLRHIKFRTRIFIGRTCAYDQPQGHWLSRAPPIDEVGSG